MDLQSRDRGEGCGTDVAIHKDDPAAAGVVVPVVSGVERDGRIGLRGGDPERRRALLVEEGAVGVAREDAALLRLAGLVVPGTVHAHLVCVRAPTCP